MTITHASPRPTTRRPEIAALICLIVSIDSWNAVGVSTHAWRPGTYEI